MDVLYCRTCLNHVSALTSDFCQLIIRVNSLFHNLTPVLLARYCRNAGQHYITQKKCRIIPSPLQIKTIPQKDFSIIIKDYLLVNSFQAFLATFCSASFLLFPASGPKTAFFKWTETQNVLSWSGPSSFTSSYVGQVLYFF